MATQGNLLTRLAPLGKHSHLAVPIAVVMILMVMIVPLPPLILDFFISIDIVLSVIILLVAIASVFWVDSRYPALLKRYCAGSQVKAAGALTFGRTTRDFFTKGPDAAKRTWKANAANTKTNAKAGGRAVRSAAKGG